MANWDSTSPEEWTRAFGLVAVPYFGRSRTDVPRGTHKMMQDGETASFALHITSTDTLLSSPLPLEWAWSAHVRHSVWLDPATQKAVARRWDDPSYRDERIISTEREAERFISSIERSPRQLSGQDVIEKTLNTLNLLRAAIEERGGGSLDVVLAFNAVLLIAGRWRKKPERIPMEGLAEVVGRLRVESHPGFKSEFVSQAVQGYPVGEFARTLLEHNQQDSPYLLDAELLIRHASGRLYQEFHRRLATKAPPSQPQPQQQLFWDHGLPTKPEGKRKPPPGYVHHTPSWLARALVEFSLGRIRGIVGKPLEVLDPACGSGIFLIETVRELERLQVGEVHLHGMDLSPEAGIMTEFCVGEASRDLANVSASQSIRYGIDSLTETDWGQPDIILMNPPFQAWKDLGEAERATVRRVLGPYIAHRPDLYLAFLVRAAKALRHGGVLASVVPSTFFSGKTATKVRALLSGGEFRLRLIGLFRGFETFDSAMVEAAVIVVSRSCDDSPVRTVIADKGRAEKAVRLLRTVPDGRTVVHSGIEIGTVPAGSLDEEGWLIQGRSDVKFADKLSAHTKSRVQDLVTVRLGVRGIGARECPKVLLVSEDTYPRLVPTAPERRYFRPVADKIEDGRIKPGGYLFYPYGTDRRLLLATEDELAAAVPTFYRQVLLPAKRPLQERASLNRGKRRSPNRNWWEPSEPVTTWLASLTPKIVSQEFGRRGHFAFDEDGRYAVVGGHGWCWKGGAPHPDTMFAYLALLNSRVFDRLLKVYCPPLQGQQLRLEARFVHQVPLPDLTHVGGVLAAIGKRIHGGNLYDDYLLDEAVKAAYLADHFRELVEAWRKETEMRSSISLKINHPAYREIIGMGKEALLLILQELRDRPGHWFEALKTIAKETPVRPEERSDPRRARDAWLRWGKERGLIE